MATNGCSGSIEDSGEGLNLPHEEATCGTRHECGRTDNRRVAAVACAECIVDEVIESVDESADERRVVCLFAGVESQVVHDRDPGCELGHCLSDRGHVVARVDLALRAAQMAAHHDLCAVRLQPGEGRERCAESEIVGDFQPPVLARVEGAR